MRNSNLAFWILGTNTGFPPEGGYGDTAGWDTNILPALNDGISLYVAYRYTGNTEVYKFARYIGRHWGNRYCGVYDGDPRHAMACNKGDSIDNVMMFDEANTTKNGVYPFEKVSGMTAADGPINADLAALYIAALFYDLDVEVGLGRQKTEMLLWKTISLITSSTALTMRQFGAKIQQAARQLWPDPLNPTLSIYENDIVQALTSRGIPMNGVADFRTNLPAAISPVHVTSANNFGSTHPENQYPSGTGVGSYGSGLFATNGYTAPTAPASYMAYQFYKHSKYGPEDKLAMTDGTFTSGVYNNDGTFYYEMTGRELGNTVVLAPGGTIRWVRLKKRADNEGIATYWEDTNPFGFRVTKAVRDGYTFTASAVSETATTKTYNLSVVDPSLATLGAATYAWAITDYAGAATNFSGQTVQITVPKDQPFTLTLDRTRGVTTDTMSWRERGNDLDRSHGNAFVRNFVAGSIQGKVFDDKNGNGILDGNEKPLAGVTMFLDANDNGMLDTGERRTTSKETGVYLLDGVGAGQVPIRL